MIPPRILETFRSLPRDVIELCRPQAWAELTTPPREGMKSIRDILAHMVSAEMFWMRHVILGEARRRVDPPSFGDLNAILAVWDPQRAETLAFVQALTPEQRTSRRAFPWNASETASLEEIVWHVVTHEQYHRGQIFTRLALLGRRDLPDHDLLR